MMTATCAKSEIIGQIRVQSLGPYLVRIEQKGPMGFEDRQTFTIQDRAVDADGLVVTRDEGHVILSNTHYCITFPEAAEKVEGLLIETADGDVPRLLSSRDLKTSFFPTPSALPETWIMADSPRVVPPSWGALPPPEDRADSFSGWDLTNQAPDFYVFFPKASGYERFRADFLRLTGPVPMLPLYAFGLWYSRYHPYSEETALEVIERFRKDGIPLDVFVNDTDWRKGASCGYAVNTELFPDMRRFIERAHEKNVRLMYNDHPEPVGQHALAPEELSFRYKGLTSLLEQGVDVWWFDRNWHTHLQSPAPGLNKEVWGMKLYHDITQACRPGRRPLIMSNVDGINNGQLESPSHPAAHRYPIWWTGDTIAEWKYLVWGVQNGVDSGVLSLLPYVHEDLGGHHGQPDAEYYTRFMQFGAFSPVARIHSTAGKTRYPWQYGPETEKVVGDFFRLRYRLLPMIYSAAYQAHKDGTPLMRRCDLEWPQYPAARDNTQYLFGDDLLIAPILAAGNSNHVARRKVWIPEGEWEDVWTGAIHKGPSTLAVKTPLFQYPIFVRRGGMIVTVPQLHFTKNAQWRHLILDAFIPAHDMTTTRIVYEDDGLSTAYTNGAYGITQLSLQRKGSNVTLRIAPSDEFQSFPMATREWTLRLSLPRGQLLKSVRLNGQPMAADQITELPPDTNVPTSPFGGVGTRPPPHSGMTIEIHVDVPSTTQVTELAVEM
ncbi:MAG: TIM-barrel domain-containing protein [Lentisphaerota bacterium]